MKKKNKNFIKRDKCPYCTYSIDSATVVDGGEEDKPHPGCVTFCLMCTEPSVYDFDMNLVKFDLNTIQDLLERNTIKGYKSKIEEFWEKNPCEDGRQEKYLRILDRRNEKM